jgi:hypothetical protein
MEQVRNARPSGVIIDEYVIIIYIFTCVILALFVLYFNSCIVSFV